MRKPTILQGDRVNFLMMAEDEISDLMTTVVKNHGTGDLIMIEVDVTYSVNQDIHLHAEIVLVTDHHPKDLEGIKNHLIVMVVKGIERGTMIKKRRENQKEVEEMIN